MVARLPFFRVCASTHKQSNFAIIFLYKDRFFLRDQVCKLGSKNVLSKAMFIQYSRLDPVCFIFWR